LLYCNNLPQSSILLSPNLSFFIEENIDQKSVYVPFKNVIKLVIIIKYTLKKD